VSPDVAGGVAEESLAAVRRAAVSVPVPAAADVLLLDAALAADPSLVGFGLVGFGLVGSMVACPG